MMCAMTDTEQHRGRPRSTEADEAIALATMELLAEEGWNGLTMNGVAQRAGVSTATLYRRYSSKEDLVCGAMTAHKRANPPVDTGSLEGDLRVRLSAFVETIRGDGGQMILGVIGEAARNPRLREIMQSTFATGRDDFRRVIERAVERGEIPRPDDISLVASLASGPLFHRLLITGEPITQRVVERLVPMVLAALGANPGGAGE
jgi:AcrR family transcriptional regulator